MVFLERSFPLSIAALLVVAGCGLGPKAAKVRIKFDIFGGDNTFAATIYAQEVNTGQTFSFPYGPHTPYIAVDMKTPGRYVFYARLLEAADEYHYGYTSTRPVAYGHMTNGGTQDPAAASLIAVDIKPGGSYKVYVNDHWAVLPVPGKPVTVPWRSEPGASEEGGS